MEPSIFGVRPELIIKGGMIIASKMGDANASIPTPQPVLYRPMFGAHGKAKYSTCITFTSKVAYENNIKEKLNLQKLFYLYLIVEISQKRYGIQ